MRRRDFVAGAVSLAVVAPAAAERSAKTQRLAIFSVYQPAAQMQEISANGFYRAIFAELRRLGHVEGKNLTVERYGKERRHPGSLDALAAEAVRGNPDVIFAIGPGLFELMAATTAIPIVAWSYDPIEMGLTQSLAHPAGNVTGISSDTGPSIWSKRLGLLREIFPAMAKVGFLAPNTPGWRMFGLLARPHGFLS
jgi:putative ABC transport system substrate-binding protein